MSEHRAYAVVELKASSGDERVVTGVATTPEPDRVGDIVEPLGVTFNNPVTMLWQHRTDHPIALAKLDKPTKNGVTFTARFPKDVESPTLKARIDEAWESIKLGLVRGISIGFRSLERSLMDNGSIRFMKTEILEISLVTVPANMEATVQTVKSLDAASATGNRSGKSSSGVSDTVVSLKPKAPKDASTMPTIAEQIASFETKRSTNAARMTEIMNKAAEESRTLDTSESDEYDGFEVENAKIDEHLKRLYILDKQNKQTLKPVEKVDTPEKAAETRGSGNGSTPSYITMRLNGDTEKWLPSVRMLQAKYQAFINNTTPIEIYKNTPQWHNTPQVEAYLKAPVYPGMTSVSGWASQLVEPANLPGAFAEFLYGATILGRIPGITRVPFNVKVPRQTGGATVGWVGEAAPKPVTSLVFDQITLLFNKVAGIVPVSEELLRFSSPSAEAIIRDTLARAITAKIDLDFLDPAITAITGVRPASITNGVTAITSTGTTADALRTDLNTLLKEFAADNMDLDSLVLIMTVTQAISISMMVNTLGQPEFPTMTKDGGSLAGIPVIVSQNIMAVGGSPADGYPIIALSARDILLADDGGVTLDISREASLQMDTAPDSPATASTVLVSLWQHNLVGIRAERFITYRRRRDEAVQYISNAKYV